jgi:hypothetical protein
MGQVVHVIPQVINNSKVEMNIEHLAPGVYYVSLTNSSLTKVLKLIVEQ